VSSVIERVAIPPGTLAAGAFTRIDYADAYRVRLPAASPRDIDSLTHAALTAAPAWASMLMRLRDGIAGLVGLKTSRRGGSQPRVLLQPGASIGIFRVLARAADEILLGQDDRHLDFRVSVLLQSERGDDWVVVSTLVRFNNWLGRAYFLPVRPLHRLIVPAMMRRALHSALQP
jgi:hypothetical protein